MDANTIIGIVVAIIALAGIAFGVWAFLRYRYVKSLREKGWEFITSPDSSVAFGLNVPPFGVGIGRRFDDLVRGEIDGWRFQVFEYKFQGFKENRVTTVQLPRPLGEFHLQAGQLESGTFDKPEADGPDQEWAEVAKQALEPALPAITAGPSTILTIDGEHVVLLDTPEKPDEMERHIHRAIAAARALSEAPAPRRDWPKPAPQLGFHGTDWKYEPANNQALSRVTYTHTGYDHRAVDVITGPNDGLPFVVLEHKWKTKETSTDSKGRTTTRTVHHNEFCMEMDVPFPFSPLSVNWGIWSGGDKREFESISFNKTFTVRSDHPKFAHDVIHPRVMQWMEQCGEVRFSIDKGKWRWNIRGIDPTHIRWMLDYSHGFFAQVPDFVWKDLGHPAPPSFRRSPLY